ncbi:MAG: MFS transporter [Candidatus Lutacidiplasmatales archaeon]
MARALGSYRSLTSNRQFRYLLLGGAFSFGAPTATLVVLIWSVAVAYPSTVSSPTAFAALALSFLGLAATLPTLGTAFFSGTLADRLDRLWLLRLTNALALAATLGLAFVLMMRPGGSIALPGPPGYYLPLWVLELYPLWALSTASTTVFRPTFNASVPRLVSTAELGRANGLVYASALIVSVGGSLLTTALVGWVGAAMALAVPATLFALTQLFMLPIRGDFRPAPDRPKRRFLQDAQEGYRYLWRRKALLQLTLSALAINFFSAVAFVELGLYVSFWLGADRALYVGAMVAGSSLGAFVGTLLINRFRFESRAGRVLAVLTVFQGVAVLGLAFERTIWLSVPDIFFFGVFPGMATTVLLATVQATVPDEMLGRVFAADEVGSYAMVPPGQYAGGLITIATGVQFTYILAGAGTIAIGLVMAGLRSLRALAFDPHVRGPVSEAPGPPPGATADYPAQSG